jgi:hypothetical protein
MHIHQPHFGQVVSVSANGRSAIAHAHVVNTQSRAAIPSYVQEDLATNAAVESWDFSYDLGDTTLLGEVQAPETDGIVLAKKKKVYENSVGVFSDSTTRVMLIIRKGLSYAYLGERTPRRISQ